MPSRIALLILIVLTACREADKPAPVGQYVIPFYVNGQSGAVYDMQSKPLLRIHTTACGAEQLQDRTGRPVWPLDVTGFCDQSAASQ